MPKTKTSNNKAMGRYDKRDFIFNEQDNEYVCPAGKRLPCRHSSVEDGMKIYCYYNSTCPQCELKEKCTTGQERRVRRWEHEGVLDIVENRMNHSPGKMRQRRCTVEHVFGTLKFWMGAAHFLTKTIDNVSTEMSLHVLAYNLRRVIKILGMEEMMKMMQLEAA